MKNKDLIRELLYLDPNEEVGVEIVTDSRCIFDGESTGPCKDFRYRPISSVSKNIGNPPIKLVIEGNYF